MGKHKKHDDEEESQNSDDQDSNQQKKINTDNSPKDIPVAKLPDKLKCKKIVLNVSDTQYPIITEVGEELGWIIQQQEGIGDWDVWWTDREIEPNTLYKMNLYQKINHFPGIYVLARKNLLGLHLMAMQTKFPQDYNFFPETWMIPIQFSQFRQYYQSVEQGKVRTYIVKPQALSQGRGIFLTRDINDIINGHKYVIQRYMKNPLLLDGLKFDLRIYVLLSGCQPLRLYIYEQGLVRLATRPYQAPTADNLHENFIHLTNYSLNKSNPDYVYNKSDKQMDVGHKRSLKSVYEKLARDGVDVDKLKIEIQDCITKTVISGLPSIRHQYRYCQPEDYQGNMCFHILGFDVMILDDFTPIVIQVNHTPSFQTGTPLDYQIKKNLIKDTLKLMRITQKQKKSQFQRSKQLTKKRIETGKRQILKGQERTKLLEQVQKQRQQQQKTILSSTTLHNGYKQIYPFNDEKKNVLYQKFYEAAESVMKEQKMNRKKIILEQKISSSKNDIGSNKIIKNKIPPERKFVTEKNVCPANINSKPKQNKKNIQKKLSINPLSFEQQQSLEGSDQSGKSKTKQPTCEKLDSVKQEKQYQTLNNCSDVPEVNCQSEKKIISSCVQSNLKGTGFQIRSNSINRTLRKPSLNGGNLNTYNPGHYIMKEQELVRNSTNQYTELMQKFARSKDLEEYNRSQKQQNQSRLFDEKMHQKHKISREFADEQIYHKQYGKGNHLSRVMQEQNKFEDVMSGYRQRNNEVNIYTTNGKQKIQESFLPKHQIVKHPRHLRNINTTNMNGGNKKLLIETYLNSKDELTNNQDSSNRNKQQKFLKSDHKLGNFVKPKTYNLHQNKFNNEGNKLNPQISPPTLHNFNVLNNNQAQFIGMNGNLHNPIYHFQHYNQVASGVYPSVKPAKNVYQGKNKVHTTTKNIVNYTSPKPLTGHNKSASVVYKNYSLPLKDSPILMKFMDKEKIKGYQ